jgi:hypothetical protein
MTRFTKYRKTMTAPAYEIVGEIISKIVDPTIRQAVANHFGTEFNRRSPSFDPAMWHRKTGGNVAPNSAFGTTEKDKIA